MDPPPLQELAARAAAQFKTCQDLTSNKGQFELGLQKKGINLIDWIDKHEGLVSVRFKLNHTDSYQKLLLHVLKEYEECLLDPLRATTAKEFERLFKQVDEHLNNTLDKNFSWSSNESLFSTKQFDWVTQSLGCTKVFQERRKKFSAEKCFFLQKFNTFLKLKIAVDRPSLTPDLEMLLPKTLSDASIVTPTGYKAPRICMTDRFDDQNVQLVVFFHKLYSMLMAYQNEADHRLIAFAFQLFTLELPPNLSEEMPDPKKEKLSECLQTKYFRDVPFFRPYYIHVWGMLGVGLARVCCNAKWVAACAQNCHKLAMMHSQKIEALVYQQRMLCALGWFENEREIFYQLLPMVPRCSNFYAQIWQCHFFAGIAAVENYFFYIMTVQKHTDEEELYFAVSAKNQQLLKKKQEYLEQSEVILRELRKLIHKVCYENTDHRLEVHLQGHHDLLDLYDTLSELYLSGVIRRRHAWPLKTVAARLHTNSFFSQAAFANAFLRTDNGVAYYDNRLHQYKRVLTDCSNTQSSIQTGHLLFTHLLFMEAVDTMFGELAEDNAPELHAIYKNFHHSRCALVRAYRKEQPHHELPENLPALRGNFVFEKDAIDFKVFLSDKKIVNLCWSGIHS